MTEVRDGNRTGRQDEAGHPDEQEDRGGGVREPSRDESVHGPLFFAGGRKAVFAPESGLQGAREADSIMTKP